MQRAAVVWENMKRGLPASGEAGPPAPAQISQADVTRILAEIKDTQRAAMHGDVAAMTRLVSFGRVMAGHSADIPNPADIIAAQRGDPAAIARLRARHEAKPDLHSTGLQTESMLSFHPPLKRRLKRLNRMGAHITLGSRQMSMGARLFMAALFLIIGPLLLVAGCAMLVAIAMIIMLNLFFLALWLMAIHGIFWWLAHR